MIAKSLAEYLEDRNLGTVGTDIYVGELPSSNDSGIYLVAVGGGGQDAYLDTFYEDIDIWSVHSRTDTAYSALEGVRNVLSRATNYDTDDHYVYYSQDISGIMDFDRSNDGLKLFKVTIRFIFRDKNIIS